MNQIPYINCQELGEFYTVQELAGLLHVGKLESKKKCKQYDIKPRRNEIGDYGFVRFDVRKLHNLLYYESCGNRKEGGRQREDDPWA